MISSTILLWWPNRAAQTTIETGVTALHARYGVIELAITVLQSPIIGVVVSFALAICVPGAGLRKQLISKTANGSTYLYQAQRPSSTLIEMILSLKVD